VTTPAAFVTGASPGGIGRGIGRALARAGYDIAYLDVDAGNLDGAVTEIHELGARAFVFAGDVADRAAVDDAIARVVAQTGRLDVLVNNAQATELASVLDTTLDALERVWRSGVVGTLNGMQAAYPHLVTTGGSVINLVSGAALSATPGYGAYAATKSAIKTLTRVTATEWGPAGVRVNAISPSARTPALERWAKDRPDEAAARERAIPLQRFGDAEHDIGRVAVFLASADAAYVTGQTIVVDGGVHQLG
jgi:NAD(P)-dependent dehydrogenase (short-subunit alcohol dehydrogenase family)